MGLYGLLCGLWIDWYFKLVANTVSTTKWGLMIFQEENLSAMNTDPWYSAYHYSHPPLVERLAAIDEETKKTDWYGKTHGWSHKYDASISIDKEHSAHYCQTAVFVSFSFKSNEDSYP